jgi:response regulator RpfG family c-di-GMP phosphodiesterase
VQRGFRLDRRTISRLTELGVQHMWLACGDLPEVDGKINGQIIEGQEELSRTLAQTVDQLRHRTEPAVDCAVLEEKVGKLLSEILNDPTHQPILENVAVNCNALVRHLTNCCYVCLLLGTHLSGYVRKQRRRMPVRMAEDIRQLGMGAFVHDLGKARLPDELRDVNVLDPESENATYRAHTTLGYELVRGQVSALAGHVIIHHHQRFDGQGFPKVPARGTDTPPAGLEGERIHIFARILAAADAFDHLLGTPADPRPTITALHALGQPRFAGWFDPVVVAALNRLMPPFMLGSIVTLSDGGRAVVVENHPCDPCQPTVRRVVGEAGTPSASIAEEPLDLREWDDLHVAQIDDLDVTPYYFDAPDLPEGLLAYWGLRRKVIQSVTLDPDALVTAQEAAGTSPDP